MVLIRLCHVGDLPTPGDLVRRLTNAGSTSAGGGTSVPAPTGEANGRTGSSLADPGGNAGVGAIGGDGPPAHGGGGAAMSSGGTMAMAGSAAFAMPAVETAPAVPRLAAFRDVATLVKEQRQAMLHAHLLHSVHLVRFAPPVIELRPEPDAPRDLAGKLAALLTDATGTRWTIALSTAAGEPTLAEQGNAADAQRRLSVADHPLVRAIMENFPGARIETVHDASADAYGLPITPAAITLGEPDMPEFAPPDAEYMDEMEPD
jgi:DNA polymerase-3 subunit gamma/tau